MNRTARFILATGVALAVALPISGGLASAAPSCGSGSAATPAATTTGETTITVRDCRTVSIGTIPTSDRIMAVQRITLP